jgi:uncharacterized protein YPO0396
LWPFTLVSRRNNAAEVQILSFGENKFRALERAIAELDFAIGHLNWAGDNDYIDVATAEIEAAKLKLSKLLRELREQSENDALIGL